MNEKSFYLIMIVSIMISACSGLEAPSIPTTSTDETRSSAYSTSSSDSTSTSTLEERRAIAKWFAENYTQGEGLRVSRAVAQALRNGLDEVFYLNEYISSPSSQNKISDEVISEGGKELQKILANSPDLLATSTPQTGQAGVIPLHFYRDLQIYWPYSNNWDGKTAPAMVYAPENPNAETAEGFIPSVSNGRVQRVIVNEEYCMNHPVWIINNADIPYDELPIFTKGESEANGVHYVRKVDSTAIKDNNDNDVQYSSPPDLESLANTVYLGRIRSTKQHDNWFNGGSEYRFTIGSTDTMKPQSESDLKNAGDAYCVFKICITRKEIKEKKWFDVNSIAISNWSFNLNNIKLCLIEEDQGKDKDQESGKADIKLTWKDLSVDINLSFKFSNSDDFLGMKNYDRKFIFSNGNKISDTEWFIDSTDGVYWTLPFKYHRPVLPFDNR